MAKQRLDQLAFERGLAPSRSQAESWIKLGQVKVNGQTVSKPGAFVRSDAKIQLLADKQYVSRAGLKLASVAKILNLNFKDKIVLDVGSSTGGFTDYALKNQAKKVIAVDVGTNQLHPSLRINPKVELHEQTDILNVPKLSAAPDIVVIDVSFVSVKKLLPHIANLCAANTQFVVMVKPQFEAGAANKHKGVIKNDAVRREVLRNFEAWSKEFFVIISKADSAVAGAKGNRERFYLLAKLGSL